MKTFALLLALVFGLASTSRAQIFVGSGGLPAPLTFDSAPTLLAVEWASATNALPGDGGTYTSTGDVASAVQTLNQNIITESLQRITFDNTFGAARHNITAGYVITQPTVVGVGVLKATLRNTHNQAFSHVTVSYNFGFVGTPGLESAPGHQVFFSTNGLPGSWRLIPAFSSLTSNASVNATLFVGRWLPNTDIYLLWADDNAPTSGEPGHTIDNFNISGPVVTNVALPLSVTLIAPAHGTLAFTPVTATATAAGSTAVTNVAFYTNGVLAANDTTAPYSAVLNGLAGTNTIYARAFNSTGSVYSATNTVRVRPEFAEYTGLTYTQNFDSMGPTGTETPPGWYAGVTLPATTVDVTPGDGSSLPVEAVHGWNYGTIGSGDRALGTSPTAGERNMVLRLRNSSGQPLTGFTLQYDGEVWRNYTNVASGWLTNYYSTNLGATWIPTTFHFQQPFASVPVPPQSAVDGNLPGNRTANLGGTVTLSPPLPAGGIIYLRWHDANESGTDGALAVENVVFTGVFPPANDTCAGADYLYDGYSDFINPLNLTTNGDPPFVCSTTVGPGAWYRFQPSANGRITLNTSSPLTTKIDAYLGSCGALSFLTCGSAPVSQDVFVGNTYRFFVAPTLGNNGPISLNVDVCEAPHDITVVVDSVANVSGGIQVTYRADYSGDTAFNFEWSFDGNFKASTSGSYFSYTFDVFDTFPDIVSCRIFNSCGNGLGGNTVTPPCGAICLSIGSTATYTSDNGGGSAHELNTACGNLDFFNTKWFRLGADQSAAGLAFLSISNSSPDTMITVYRGSIIDSSLLVELDCATNSGTKRVARFETRPGTNYYVAARSANLSALNIRHGYEFVPPAPGNDMCANATIMTPGLTYYTNTMNATAFEAPPASGCVPSFGRGVWYSFFANTTGPVLVDTCGSDFDTALQVYTGSCGALTPVAGGCTNNTGLRCPTSNRAGLRFNAISGTTYRILVGGASEAAGNLVISATPCQAPGLTTFSSVPQLVTNGVRVSYQADFIGNTPYGWRWSFNDGQVFTTTSNSLTRLFGPFLPFPSSVTVSATNLCGTNTTTVELAQPCGAICLASAIGTNLVHTGTTGSGPKGGSQSATCGNFPPSTTLWFRLATLTNASGRAVISSAGSGFDTRLGVFRGTSNALAEVTCNDNFNGTLQSQVEFETRAGTNYWLAVNASEGAPLVLTYGYPVSFASVVLTNVGGNRALDLRTLPLPSYQYRLRGGTNLSVPPANWSNLITTNFSNSISASTNILRYRDTNLPLFQQRYYRIERVP